MVVTLAVIKREKERMDTRLYDMALTLIENRARAILAAHKNLDEFVMGMGSWIFTKRNSGARGRLRLCCEDNISTVYREYISAYAIPFTRMMDEFDDMKLKVTGEPMRFTAQGPVVKGWGGTDGLDGAAVAEEYGQ